MNTEQKIEAEAFVMWDAINGDFYEHDSLDSVLKDLKENYCDPEEGIHPDIESIRIFKEVADVVVEQIEGKETYRVKLVSRAAYIAGRSAGLEREKEYRELLNIIRDDGGFEWLHSTTREKIEQLLNHLIMDNNLYRWVKASESPKTEGYYVCSVNNGFICSVYFNLKNGWFFNSSYAFQGQVKEWLEKIEADQQEKQLSDALKEVERLKTIIINQYYWNKEATQEEKDKGWQEFKINHNI